MYVRHLKPVWLKFYVHIYVNMMDHVAEKKHPLKQQSYQSSKPVALLESSRTLSVTLE